MSPITTIVFFFTLFFVAFAAPIDTTGANLAKRSYTGRGTWFEVGLGACGDTNVDSDKIIAISSKIYGDGTYCDKTVKISYGGNTATATVKDECPSCSSGSIDMSPSLFEEFSDLDTGVLEVTWEFTD